MDLLLPEMGVVSWIIFFIVGVAVPIAAVISLFRSGKSSTGKIGWLLAILLFPVIGALFYFVMGRRKE